MYLVEVLVAAWANYGAAYVVGQNMFIAYTAYSALVLTIVAFAHVIVDLRLDK